jgi:hypothetical protein
VDVEKIGLMMAGVDASISADSSGVVASITRVGADGA